MPRRLFVYILECADGSYYTGVTNNPIRRLREHEDGISQTAYTYSRRPLKMVHLEAYRNFMVAIRREKQIKKWSKAKKTALVEGNIPWLEELSNEKNRRKF